VRVVAAGVNPSFWAGLCMTLEMLKKISRARFSKKKGAISGVSGYCALFKKYFYPRLSITLLFRR